MAARRHHGVQYRQLNYLGMGSQLRHRLEVGREERDRLDASLVGNRPMYLPGGPLGRLVPISRQRTRDHVGSMLKSEPRRRKSIREWERGGSNG